LLDLASDLRQSREARLREVGEAMAARLRELAGVGGDRHRQRRLLVQDLADAAGAIGAGEPVLVVLEDLHWADQLSLEVVAHLATRLAGRPLLVAGAYRSDELYPRLPMREWRARRLTQRLAEEVRLPRLTRDQTAALTGVLLGDALRRGEAMAELHRLSPALWGLAEAALLGGDPEEATAFCDRGHEASARVGDAAYLFPFLVTGVRARLAAGRAGDAERWHAEVAGELAARSVPGTLVAVDHARGLLELTRGDLPAARAVLERAAAGWRERRRFWEGTWARLDQARCALAARRVAEATSLAREVRDLAAEATAATIVAEADRLLATASGGRPDAPWSPLTAREFEVARLVAAGTTNRQIAAELFLSPKTVGSHVEHILTKLGAARRAEIAAWVAALPPGPGPAAG
jgi:DNA-binding CsgD family transcriptional regulator